MNSPDHYDIIIVGGGPAGAACGTLLAREGLRVLICEKAKFPRDKICGECVNPRCWQYFELLGIADDLRSLNLQRIETFRVSGIRGSSLSGKIPTVPEFPFFSISRTRLDHLLLSNAKRSGAEVLEATAVTTIDWADCWKVTTSSGRMFTAEILIGADGRNSLVARKMSDFSPRSNKERSRTSLKDNRVGVQWHASHQPTIGSAVQMFLFDSGYAGVVNIDADRANIALVTRPEIAQLAQTNVSSFLAKTLFSNPVARNQLELLAPVGKILTAFPITPALHYSNHPNALLIGDARQTVEPFTGEGIFFALQDGFFAAQRILTLYRKNHSPKFSRQNRLLANTLVSPVLRSSTLAENFALIGSKLPFLASPILKSLFLQ